LLWPDETCLWDVSKKINSNQDAEKAAIRKIAEKMDIDIDYVSFFSKTPDSSAATTATTPAAAATTLNPLKPTVAIRVQL